MKNKFAPSLAYQAGKCSCVLFWQVLEAQSISRLRIANGTMIASTAKSALSLWLVRDFSQSVMMSFVPNAVEMSKLENQIMPGFGG